LGLLFIKGAGAKPGAAYGKNDAATLVPVIVVNNEKRPTKILINKYTGILTPMMLDQLFEI
jgi:hypothetical protein